MTLTDIMIQCGSYRRLESPLSKDRLPITMENHSNHSFDGTRTLPLLDDYRLDEKDISVNFDSPLSASPDWNTAKARPPSGKRALTGDKGKPGKCKVCGDLATGMYFGALVCVPCKTFFLRYEGDNFNFVCKGNKDCEITMATRTQCKFCRYQKCRDAGMVRRVRPAHVNLNEGQQLCVVCHDVANGIHFGAVTCEGCKKFFRRGLSEHAQYSCKNGQNCVINPRTRNSCRFCRYKTCLSVGMSREAIQMGRPSKLAMESSSIQRSLKTIGANSGIVRSDQNTSNRQMNNAAGRTKELTNHYLMGSSHHPKEEPLSWDWPMEQTVPGHPFHSDISFAGQMVGVCDFLDSPIKRASMDSCYTSPHLDSGLLTPCSSNGGDRNSSNSCLSLMNSASPEGLQYGHNGWVDLPIDISKSLAAQPVALNTLYHNSGGSVHQMASSADLYQACTSNHLLTNTYSNKINIPQSVKAVNNGQLHFLPSAQQPSKLGQFDLLQPAKLAHFDQTTQMLQYKEMKDVLDSLLDDSCQTPDHIDDFNHLEQNNLKYGSPVYVNPTTDQQRITGENLVVQRSPQENGGGYSLVNHGHSADNNKRKEPELAMLANMSDADLQFPSSKSSQVGKQNGSCCFSTGTDATSSSLTMLSHTEPSSFHHFDSHNARTSAEGGYSKTTSSKCTPPHVSNNEVSTGMVRINPREDTMAPLTSMPDETKSNVDTIAEWVHNLHNSLVGNNDEIQEADSGSDELTEICKSLVIDNIPFEQQIERSAHYWRYQDLPDEDIMVGAEHWKIFNHVHPLYANFVSLGTTMNHNLRFKFDQWKATNKENTHQQTMEWVKENVVPVYTDLSRDYFSQIQGFKSFDVEDQQILLRLAQSQSRILAAAISWYNPDSQNFTDFLPWREPKPGQVDVFKQHLISYARKIHARNLDPVEAALFNIVVVVATDYPGLRKPEIIESYRMLFMATFRAYTTAKYGTPNKKMEQLFQLVPQLRRLGMLHYAMTLTPNLGITVSNNKGI